jgi:hypothetical protein
MTFNLMDLLDKAQIFNDYLKKYKTLEKQNATVLTTIIHKHKDCDLE